MLPGSELYLGADALLVNNLEALPFHSRPFTLMVVIVHCTIDAVAYLVGMCVALWGKPGGAKIVTMILVFQLSLMGGEFLSSPSELGPSRAIDWGLVAAAGVASISSFWLLKSMRSGEQKIVASGRGKI